MSDEIEKGFWAIILTWVGWVSLASSRSISNYDRIKDIHERQIRIEGKLDRHLEARRNGKTKRL